MRRSWSRAAAIFAVVLTGCVVPDEPLTAGETGLDESHAPPAEPVHCGTEYGFGGEYFLKCGTGEICVQPPEGCDYSGCSDGGEAVWVTPEPYCVPFPDECVGGSTRCLEREACEPGSEESRYSAGLLECGGGALDCFC